MKNEPENLPRPDESLAEYVRRARMGLKMSQRELADRARMHVQSLGKIEKGETKRLSGKTKAGLARVLGVSVDVLDAVYRGVSVLEVRGLKICPRCWVPGSEAEAMWLEGRAKFCFLCGCGLRSCCSRCGKPIESLKHSFCPFCGQSYKDGGKVL